MGPADPIDAKDIEGMGAMPLLCLTTVAIRERRAPHPARVGGVVNGAC